MNPGAPGLGAHSAKYWMRKFPTQDKASIKATYINTQPKFKYQHVPKPPAPPVLRAPAKRRSLRDRYTHTWWGGDWYGHSFTEILADDFFNHRADDGSDWAGKVFNGDYVFYDVRHEDGSIDRYRYTPEYRQGRNNFNIPESYSVEHIPPNSGPAPMVRQPNGTWVPGIYAEAEHVTRPTATPMPAPPRSTPTPSRPLQTADIAYLAPPVPVRSVRPNLLSAAPSAPHQAPKAPSSNWSSRGYAPSSDMYYGKFRSRRYRSKERYTYHRGRKIRWSSLSKAVQAYILRYESYKRFMARPIGEQRWMVKVAKEQLRR